MTALSRSFGQLRLGGLTACLLFAAVVSSTSAAEYEYSPGGKMVHVDPLGFRYIDAQRNGSWVRLYQRPHARAAAYFARGQVAGLGLPDTRGGALSGVDFLSRRWYRDRFGYRFFLSGSPCCPTPVYYLPCERAALEPAAAALRQTVWPAAVRQAARNTVVRGFGGRRRTASRPPGDPHDVQAAARHAFTAAWNAAGRQSHGAQAAFVQRLVEQGIEDAIVDAMNTARSGVPRLLPARPEPSRSRSHRGPGDRVTTGWLVTPHRIVPIGPGESYVLVRGQGGDAPAEVWQGGRRLFQRARYVRYFEDLPKERRP